MSCIKSLVQSKVFQIIEVPDCILLRFEINKSKALADRIPSFTVPRDCWNDIEDSRSAIKSQF